MPSRAEPEAEVEPPHHREKPAAHVGDADLQAREAVEQAGEDHARERHRGVERAADHFVELVLVHLLVVADRHAHRMDEQRHLLVLRPFPERKGVLVVDEGRVPARIDEQPLEAERPHAALAFRDLALVERIDACPGPTASQARRPARAISAAIWSLPCRTTSIAGFFVMAVTISAVNGLDISRPVMPALAQTCCWRRCRRNLGNGRSPAGRGS